MQVYAEKEDERELIKKILKNHGIDCIVTNSVIRYLFGELYIERKNKLHAV